LGNVALGESQGNAFEEEALCDEAEGSDTSGDLTCISGAGRETSGEAWK